MSHRSWVVHRDRVRLSRPLQGGLAFVGRGHVEHHPFNPGAGQLAGRSRNGPYGALHLRPLGDHVVGRAGADSSHGDDSRLEDVQAPSDHGLQSAYDLAGNGHRVEGIVGHRSMPAATGHDHFEHIRRCHQRPRPGVDGP